MSCNDDRANARTLKCSCCGRAQPLQRYLLTFLCRECTKRFVALFAKSGVQA